MKTRKSIRAVFALMLAAAFVCGSLPTALASRSDGLAVTLPDGGTYILTDYTDEGDFEVYYVNSAGTRLTQTPTDSTVGVSIRGVRQQISYGTAGYLYIPETYGGYPVVRMEKPAAGNRYLGIRIPATVKEIADTTFSTCPYLEWIEVDDANTSYFSVDGVLYRGNLQRAGLTSLVCYPQGKKDESFTTSPDGDGIADRAFNENPYLKTLTIAVGALGTDVGAICNCTALETLIFGEGQMSLDFFSVTGCSALKTIHFSDWFLNFLDYMNADEIGGGEIADYLDRIGTDDLTVCCAVPSALLEAAAQEAGFGYSVCGETHTYAQDPNAPTVSAETAFWFTNYYQQDADGKNVLDENGLPIVIGYAVEGLLTRNVADAARVIIPAYHFGLPVMEIHNLATAFDNLVSVHIPATVESITPYAFLPGEQITAFTVDDDSPYFKSVDGVLYTADGKTLVAYPQAKADTVFTIPQGTERLADSEYVRLSSNLRQLNIPASFTDRQIAKVLRRPGLETIRVDAGNPALFADASGVLYNKDQTALLHYPTYGPQDYTLPTSVMSIAENAIGSNAPRTLRIADGVTVTPIGSLSVSANADESLCLHIPESVTTIRLIAKGKIHICSTTRASQAAAFAAANGLPFYICNEDHSELREPTDDDPPAPAQNEESLYDCSFIYEPDETGVERITGACLRGLMQTPDEPFVLTVPDTYCGVPVLEVNFTAQWTKEHSAKVTKIELPATVRSVLGVYNRAMLATTVNAFRNLAAVTVDGANPYLCAVDDVLFDKAMTRLILFPAAKPDVSYAIPDGVRDVKENPWEGGYVFGNNPYLLHLTIPASFTCEGKDSYGFSSAYFNALLHLPQLQDITVDPANTMFASDANGVLYNADRTHLFLYPPNAPAEIFTIPAGVDRIMSPYTFRNLTHLRVVCVAEGATSTPDGTIRANGTLQYVHIPSSVQNVRLHVSGAYHSICSDAADSAAAAYAQQQSIPFALCSDAHADFTPVLPDDPGDPDDPGETQEDLFRFTYITEKDADGVTRNTGVYIRGLKTAPTEMITLTIPETYFGLPVLQVDFNIWPDAQKEFFTQIELPKTVQSLGNLWGTTKEFTNLRSIAVDAANPYFRSIDGVLFSKDLTTLIWYPAAKTTASYAIPEGVRALGSRGAFADNMYLQHLSLPASFTEFGTVMHDCFSGLRNLQSFSVAAGNPTYSSDENGVLYNADKTTMILYPCANEAEQYTIPASVRRFGFYTPKYYPQNLRVLCIADGVTLVPSLSIPLGDSVQYLHIPSSVQDLSPYYETEKIANTVTICSDSADSAAALFAKVWRYPFEVCSDHSAGTTPVEPAEPIAMTVSGGSARPGEIVQVTVDLTKNTGIVAARLHLTYDPDVLTLIGVQDGGLLETATFVTGRDLAAVPYTVLWEDALTHTNHTATGTLVTYTFRVSENARAGTTPVTLTYDESSTYNVDLQNVACAITNGNVTVVTRNPGDSNGDGVLDLKDVVLMRRFLAGGWNVTVDTDNMDVDGDGVISLKDSTLLSRFLAGGWNVTLK